MQTMQGKPCPSCAGTAYVESDTLERVIRLNGAVYSMPYRLHLCYACGYTTEFSLWYVGREIHHEDSEER